MRHSRRRDRPGPRSGRASALLVATALALFAAPIAPAAAQPSPYGAGAAEPEPRTREEQARDEAWREAAAAEARENPSGMKRPEKLTGRPSGFWTSTRPAKGGAYRWRIMAAGVLVLGVTIFFVLRLLRRTSATRAQAS